MAAARIAEHGLRPERVQALPRIGVDVHPVSEAEDAPVAEEPADVVRSETGRSQLARGNESVLGAHEHDGRQVHASRASR